MLVRRLGRWPGKFLLLDPVEVVDDDMHSKSVFEMILETLDAGSPETLGAPERIDEVLQPYLAWLSGDPDTRAGQLLGYTYWD